VSGLESKTDPVKFSEVDESMVWQARFPSGTIANCSTSYNAQGGARFRAQAERGWFELDPAFYYDGIRGRRSDGKEISLPSGDQFAVQMDDFARCILEDKPSKVDGEEGLRDVRIMMAIYESAQTAGRSNSDEVAAADVAERGGASSDLRYDLRRCTVGILWWRWRR